MAVTKIWAIHDSVSRVVDYCTNPSKTKLSDLEQVLLYAADKEKTLDEGACGPARCGAALPAGGPLRRRNEGRGTACGRFAAHAGDEGRAHTLRCAPGMRDEGRGAGADAALRA